LRRNGRIFLDRCALSKHKDIPRFGGRLFLLLEILESGSFIDICDSVLLALQIYGFLAAIQILIRWHVAAASQSDRTGLLRDVW
jgi:hypothetical protein